MAMGPLGGGTEIKIKCLLAGRKESKSNVYWEQKNQNRRMPFPFKRRALGAAEAFWRNFDLRDGGPKAAGRLL